MTRNEAYQALTGMVTNPNLIKHHLACEAIMMALCRKFNPNADETTLNKWGIVGLLHDADYELTKDQPEKHTLILEKQLGKRLDEDVLYAIKAHNYKNSGSTPKSLMDWSMYACDELSGFIVAVAIIHPEKKLSYLTVESIMKRLNDPNFAPGANREQIKSCESQLHIPVPEFINIALVAMKKISPYLSL